MDGVRELAGKVAVITGAAGGIGRALALELAQAGMDISLADLEPAGMQQVADEVVALGRRALCTATDVRDPAALEHLLSATIDGLGGCHLMVNNAGLFHACALVETSLQRYRQVIDVNIAGVAFGSRIFGAYFAERGEGHIVNTASAAGLFPAPGMSAYSLSKYAIVGFTLQLRWELAVRGVGVTVLCPGTVKTAITMRQGVGLKQEEAQKLVERAPSAEGLARKAVRAIRRNRPLVRYGPDSYFMSLLRLLPLWLIDPLGRLIGKTALAVLDATTEPQLEPDATTGTRTRDPDPSGTAAASEHS